MESQKNGVFIKTANTSISLMTISLLQLFKTFHIKEIDSISCDKKLMGFRVHFTKAEDSKRFENGLRLEGSLLSINPPLTDLGKSKKIKHPNATTKEHTNVRASTRSSGEAGQSLETNPRQAAKRNGGKVIPNSTAKKQKTSQDDVNGTDKMVTDYFHEEEEAGASERKSDEKSNSTSADEKEKNNPSRTSTPSGSSQIVTPTTSPSLGAANTSVLSDILQSYINNACGITGALDRQTLDAFLGHVKKKSKPTQIALKYTQNIQKLKNQLQMILKLYYHNKPNKQIKEDTAFIKWLEGLMSRFDNTEPNK